MPGTSPNPPKSTPEWPKTLEEGKKMATSGKKTKISEEDAPQKRKMRRKVKNGANMAPTWPGVHEDL